MDFQSVFRQVEDACADMQVPATRLAGEQVLMSFKQASGNLEACKYILENTHNHLVQFYMASAIKESVVREYTFYQKEYLLEMKIWLLNYCLHRSNIAHYVREQILHAIAVVTKRSLDDYNDDEKHNILIQVQQLIGMSGYPQQIGICLANALVDEFSTSKSSKVGVTWDFHQRSKDFFEKNLLLPFFEISLRILHQQLQLYILNTPTMTLLQTNGSAAPVTRIDPRGDTLLAFSLNLAEKILCWDFTNPNESVLAGTFTKEENETTLEEEELFSTTRARPFPSSWRSFLLNKDVLQMFFTLLKTVQRSEMLAHRTRQCLIQLSGLYGDIFENEDQHKEYITTVIHEIMGLMNDLSSNLPERFASYEYGPSLLGVTQMIRRLISSVPLSVLFSIPDCNLFLQEVAQLSATCLRETSIDKDGLSYLIQESTWSMEAFDELLAIWVNLVRNVQSPTNAHPYDPQSSFIPPGVVNFLAEASHHIAATYIDTRLEMAKLSTADDEEDNGGYKDWDTYGDQLLSIAILARIVGQRTLERLQDLLHERSALLKAFFETGVGDGTNPSLAYIHETTHWLILISAFILADTGDSETPLIPQSIMQLSLSQINLGKNHDQVVMLSNTVLGLLDLVSLSPTTVEASHCSPRVAETLFWFVERWAKTYLLLDESNYSSLSQNIISAFGMPSSQGEGLRIIENLIDIIKRNFLLWNADPDPLLQIVKMLNSFAKFKNLRNGLLQSGKFIDLITFFMDTLNTLPESIHNSLVQTITIITSGATDPMLRQNYFNLITGAIEKRFLAVLQRPEFSQAYQQTEIITEVMNALEMFDGLALASNTSNTVLVYSFCSKFFTSFVKLLEYYRNCPEVVILVLQFFNSFVTRQDFSELSPEQVQNIYHTIVEVFKVYSDANLGKTRIGREMEEEEPYADISIILDMLSELMASEFDAYSHTEPSQNLTTTITDVSNVVFYGVDRVVPLIDLEMLKIPRLAKEYIRLVSYMVEFYPDKLSGLTVELLNNLMASLEYGIKNPINEVARLAYQAIAPLALFAHNEERKKGRLAVQHLSSPLDNFLHLVLQCLLFKDFEVDLMNSASESLVALICARRAFYNDLVQSLIAQQVPETRDRLQDAFVELSSRVPQTHPETVLSLRDVQGFREVLFRFLMNVRGFLRVK